MGSAVSDLDTERILAAIKSVSDKLEHMLQRQRFTLRRMERARCVGGKRPSTQRPRGT
jgi:hypothetical protein